MSFEKISLLAQQKKPFLFLSDFKGQRVEVVLLEDLYEADIEFCINEKYNYINHPHTLQTSPIPFLEYKKKFDKVIEKIKSGETYILNLTQATPVQTNLSLKEMFRLSNAHYKLRYKDEFLCFSPEKFIQISNNTIHTFPMKGTIDASEINAQEKILADKKEMAEHIMIVDLLRNDLSMVASHVKVEKFRYLQSIEAGEKKLLQVSSHISGTLQDNWQENLGALLQTLLPAGSISGAPKRSTVNIIESVEGYERGFFSGIFGVFDGKSLDSGVMIRFIEKTTKGYVYKSGGGITLDSDVQCEYKELQDKIYLP
ncbi:aminodeoxychorismate synthase component I [Sulfurimonas sp.]